MAISREQVLHVARLARLDLRDDEVERLTDELGAILDAVSKVAELDLADVPPTSHPLDLVNALGRRRAARVAAARRRVRERARARGRPVPGAPDRHERRASTPFGSPPRTRSALVERGEVSAAELHAAYLDAIGERDGELHAYLRTVDEPDGDEHPDRAQGRHLDARASRRRRARRSSPATRPSSTRPSRPAARRPG